jgi:hypothetical protein
MISLSAGERAEMNETAERLFDQVRANTGCTIYNKYIENREERCQRTQIEAVRWEDRKAANVLASGGNLEADKAQLMIPFSRPGYLEPREWQALADKSNYWTLQVGDVIVKGLVTDEITGVFTISDLDRKYDYVLVITIVDTFDTTVVFPHWKVGAR